MSDHVHVLVVRAAGLSWALPMDNVEQTFAMRGRRIHDVAGVPLLIFRGQSLEVLDLASALGQPCGGEHVFLRGAVVALPPDQRHQAVECLPAVELRGATWPSRTGLRGD